MKGIVNNLPPPGPGPFDWKRSFAWLPVMAYTDSTHWRWVWWEYVEEKLCYRGIDEYWTIYREVGAVFKTNDTAWKTEFPWHKHHD
jgi:hypothetical protein